MTPQELAAVIDHTLLAPEATDEMVARHCREAMELGTHSVCISPPHVALAVEILQDSPVAVCTVVGFPLGTHRTAVKETEARLAVEDGADELDMVLHRGDLVAGHDQAVVDDIRAVVVAARGRPVKVILETAALTDAQIDRACGLCARAGASFVKTSTGFGPGGATVDAVRRMRAASPPGMGIKAAGGIRDGATALALLTAGATRLGASATRSILATLTPSHE